MLIRPAFIADLERVIHAGVLDVLETMFFTTAVPSAECRCDDAHWAVAIGFRGAPSGVFVMRLNRADAQSLASAFLGREPGETTSDEDALLACELANILCGSILSRAVARGTFDLGAPELLPAAPDTADAHAAFLLDTGGTLKVSFRVSDEGTS
jgi:hypothetical protein